MIGKFYFPDCKASQDVPLQIIPVQEGPFIKVVSAPLFLLIRLFGFSPVLVCGDASFSRHYKVGQDKSSFCQAKGWFL
ncbi:hypothetical protein GR160_12325 [Flavobacterium sp. Sd200]|uniref:hypothetical protein n=1 Tax=Flavobacterium sp. Sd200 TaxID=2692211 RepID=UPI001372049E|nr:hypothetical protein [Flavobacterium sp. Sd200]MXN92012.1 hypothetical protein [Flavobacterium sp. Sd200]